MTAEANASSPDQPSAPAGPRLVLVVALLAVNLAAYAAANCFWLYLHTGQWFDFTADAYRRDLTGHLGEVLTFPLSMLSHPWMIVVTSLLLAALVLGPVAVAALYRSLNTVPFVLAIVVLGHSPVLALAVAGGCLLIAGTRVRRQRPLAASLIGLLPVTVFLLFNIFFGTDSAALMPLQRWVPPAPLVLALLAAGGGASLTALAGRLLRVRIGVLWPVLLALLGGSAATFFAAVGADELHYNLIVGRLAPGDAMLEQEALVAWCRRHRMEGLSPAAVEASVQRDLKVGRAELGARCEAFLDRYDDSPRAPEIMWVWAQSFSLQVDIPSLRAGLVKYTAAYLPNRPAESDEPDLRAACRDAWRKLAKLHAGWPPAALADWRLGELAMRDGDAAAADELLRQAEEKITHVLDDLAARREEKRSARVFTGKSHVLTEAYYRQALLPMRRLIWLMEENHALTDAAAAEALSAYLEVNPHLPSYAQRLGKLLDPAKQREKTRMGNNIKLAIAEATADVFERADVLALLAEDTSGDTDAAIEANFKLGLLITQEPIPKLMSGIKGARHYFSQVAKARPNPWQAEARKHTSHLPPATRDSGSGPD